MVGQIGKSTEIKSNGWNPDLNKGLLWQMWTDDNFKRDSYIEFVTEPKVLINPIRDIIIFEHPFLESLTKTPWYHIPLAWFPMFAYFL